MPQRKNKVKREKYSGYRQYIKLRERRNALDTTEQHSFKQRTLFLDARNLSMDTST
jgi:hypothetical protein